jgi:hypothetical protein
MSEEQVLIELGSDPELVVSVESAGRGTWRALLGDKAHGYIRIGRLPSFRAALIWLHHTTYHYYPESQYALQHPLIH